MTLKLSPAHELFHEFFVLTELSSTRFQAIAVSLGINPAFRNQLIGTGNVPCWIVPALAEGGYAGMANSPGFVVNLDFNHLKAAGFPEAEIWYALGANVGGYADHQRDDLPICTECLLTAGHAHFSDDDECDTQDCQAETYQRLPEDRQGPCWSCCEGIADDW